MFVLSYNKMHKDKPIEYSVTNTNGYSVKWKTDSSYNTYVTGLDKRKPWVIASNEKANAMWLASPSAAPGGHIVNIGSSGEFFSSNSNYTSVGLRPLICLKSGI